MIQFVLFLFCSYRCCQCIVCLTYRGPKQCGTSSGMVPSARFPDKLRLVCRCIDDAVYLRHNGTITPSLLFLLLFNPAIGAWQSGERLFPVNSLPLN